MMVVSSINNKTIQEIFSLMKKTQPSLKFLSLVKNKYLLIIVVSLSIMGLFIFARFIKTKNQVREMFKLNKELQEQGYYMADFEFKMLGIGYHLDKGNYYKSFSLLDEYFEDLKLKKNLIKVPKFKNTQEELEFYLSLQNPKTGAFMDEKYPYCTYYEPTANVLLHIQELSKQLNQPLKLKYPLRFLDDINTPEKLIEYLNDISYVGFISAQFPQTTFHNARDLLSLARDRTVYDSDSLDYVIQDHGLYTFSKEWKFTLLKWMYDFQDSETGLWGPKSKGGKLLKLDLNNTASVLKAFVDKNGNDIYDEFPLKHTEALINSSLKALSDPIPEDHQLDEMHDWNLRMPKTIKMLLRYLWNRASVENKVEARLLMESYIKVKFEKYYVSEEGAFSYYPGGKHATLDGFGNFALFKDIGALSSNKQQKLWGSPESNISERISIKANELHNKDIVHLTKNIHINSFRFYGDQPDYDNLTSNVFAVVYPHPTKVLDILDLTPKVRHWLNTTSKTMGNWHSRATALDQMPSFGFLPMQTYHQRFPVKEANQILKEQKKLVAIGFDSLQIPRYRVDFLYYE